MTKKSESTAIKEERTMRVEGSVPLARLQELLRGEPSLKLRLVASRPDALRLKTERLKD